MGVPAGEVAGLAGVVAQCHGVVVGDGRDGPGLPVGDAELPVVTPGRDPVPDTEAFTGLVDHDPPVVHPPGGDEAVADRAVERGHLFAAVGHQRLR